jgi:hypothetical protein
MDSIAANKRAAFKLKCCAYISDLASYNPHWIAGPWDQSPQGYTESHARILQRICSTCRLSPEVHNNALYIKKTMCGPCTPAAMTAYFDTLSLPSRISNCLASVGKKKTVVCPVFIEWNEQIGHAVFIIFDLKRKLQLFFDPHHGLDVQGNTGRMVRAIAKHKFHADYNTPPISQMIWANLNDSLQSKVEVGMDIDDTGLCGILSLLVALICIRFNYYNPKHMADMISGSVSQHGNQLITWYDHLREACLNNDSAKINRIVFRPSSDGYCSVFNSKTGNCCSRKVCRVGHCQYHCWQHRHIMMNCNANSKKCNATQKRCKYP